MKNLRNMLAAGLFMAGICFTAGAQTQIPLENFFKNPEKIDYQVSPDGTYFSFMAPYENRMNLLYRKSDRTLPSASHLKRNVTSPQACGLAITASFSSRIREATRTTSSMA